VATAYHTLCLGFLCVPLILVVVTWNEGTYVCSQRNVTHAETSKDALCTGVNDISETNLFYFACTLDTTTFPKLDPLLFNGPDMGDTDDLAHVVRFESPVGMQEVLSYQCVEVPHTPSCGLWKTTCLTSFTYRLQWSRHFHDASTYHASCQQIDDNGCPEFVAAGCQNPQWPSNLREGIEMKYADEVTAGQFRLNSALIPQFRADRKVALTPFAVNFTRESDFHEPARPWDYGNGKINRKDLTILSEDSETLATCKTARLGCVKMRYFESAASDVTVMTQLGTGGLTSAMVIPSSWFCETTQFQQLYPEQLVKPKFIQKLHVDSSKTWVIRVLACVVCALSLFCCFQPCAEATQEVDDCLHLLPCCGNWLGSNLEGVPTQVVFTLSVTVGVALALLAMSVVYWNSWVALVLVLVAILLVSVGCMLRSVTKQGGSRQWLHDKARIDVHMSSDTTDSDSDNEHRSLHRQQRNVHHSHNNIVQHAHHGSHHGSHHRHYVGALPRQPQHHSHHSHHRHHSNHSHHTSVPPGQGIQIGPQPAHHSLPHSGKVQNIIL